MRRLLFLYVLTLSAVCTSAQVPDWILDLAVEDTAKLSPSGHEIIPKQGVNNDIFCDAVKPALSIVRQQYRLERSGEFYGKNKRPYYGETYTLGVKISNFTLLQRGVILPWENDADYKRVNGGGKYTPVYFRSHQRQVNDSVWKETEFDFGTQFTKPTSTDSLLFLNQDKIADFGLPEDKSEGHKKGYLIWVYSTTNLQDSAMKVRFTQTAYETEARAHADISVKPDNANQTLGGIFVVPQVERTGYIKLLLVGVAVRTANNEWKLELCTEATEETAKREKPHKRKKEPRKEQPQAPADDSEPTPIK